MFVFQVNFALKHGLIGPPFDASHFCTCIKNSALFSIKSSFLLSFFPWSLPDQSEVPSVLCHRVNGAELSNAEVGLPDVGGNQFLSDFARSSSEFVNYYLGALYQNVVRKFLKLFAYSLEPKDAKVESNFHLVFVTGERSASEVLHFEVKLLID